MTDDNQIVKYWLEEESERLEAKCLTEKDMMEVIHLANTETNYRGYYERIQSR